MWQDFSTWASSSSLAKIILIIIVTWIVYLIVKTSVKNILKVAITKSFYRTSKDSRLEKRINTITNVISRTILVVLVFIAAVMILAEFGINITPVLTGAGIVGLAVGFGAQHLVRDIISGFFILIEDQFAKGDVVEIAGKSGTVKDINLRRTILRDMNGHEHIIPNGEINITTNKTKRWAKVNLDIPVIYETDIDKVVQVINSQIIEIVNDQEFADLIIDSLVCLTPEKFDDKKIIFRVNGKVKAHSQEKITRELVKRIKKAFEENKIKFLAL